MYVYVLVNMYMYKHLKKRVLLITFGPGTCIKLMSLSSYYMFDTYTYSSAKCTYSVKISRPAMLCFIILQLAKSISDLSHYTHLDMIFPL